MAHWSLAGHTMKIIFLLLQALFCIQLTAKTFPHLILHLDVNKTLIASDKTENKTIEDVINELLSRKYTDYWDETIQMPMTFDAYIRTVILPGEEHDAKLKEQRLVHLIHFVDFLKENNHPLYAVVFNEIQSVVETLKSGGGNIFPSFFLLISELNRLEIPYTLFLRSFGMEVFEIKEEINRFCQLFNVEGIFQKGVLHLEHRVSLSDPQAIYHFFHTKENAAIRDDWHYWMAGEMHAKYGKVFPIDPDDQNVLSIFFDDNIKKSSSEKNIVAPIDVRSGKILPILSLIDSKQLVSVDTIKAILNKRYFIDYVLEAIRLHQMRFDKLDRKNAEEV